MDQEYKNGRQPITRYRFVKGNEDEYSMQNCSSSSSTSDSCSSCHDDVSMVCNSATQSQEQDCLSMYCHSDSYSTSDYEISNSKSSTTSSISFGTAISSGVVYDAAIHTTPKQKNIDNYNSNVSKLEFLWKAPSKTRANYSRGVQVELQPNFTKQENQIIVSTRRNLQKRSASCHTQTNNVSVDAITSKTCKTRSNSVSICTQTRNINITNVCPRPSITINNVDRITNVASRSIATNCVSTIRDTTPIRKERLDHQTAYSDSSSYKISRRTSFFATPKRKSIQKCDTIINIADSLNIPILNNNTNTTSNNNNDNISTDKNDKDEISRSVTSIKNDLYYVRKHIEERTKLKRETFNVKIDSTAKKSRVSFDSLQFAKDLTSTQTTSSNKNIWTNDKIRNSMNATKHEKSITSIFPEVSGTNKIVTLPSTPVSVLRKNIPVRSRARNTYDMNKIITRPTSPNTMKRRQQSIEGKRQVDSGHHQPKNRFLQKIKTQH